MDSRAEHANRLSEPYRNKVIGTLSEEQRQQLLTELSILKNMPTLVTLFGESMGMEVKWRSTDDRNSPPKEKDTMHGLASVCSDTTLVETSSE
ncbi:hypothetical protein PMIN03_012473 [Paraphaeosphaeria minitans]